MALYDDVRQVAVSFVRGERTARSAVEWLAEHGQETSDDVVAREPAGALWLHLCELEDGVRSEADVKREVIQYFGLSLPQPATR